MLTIGACCDVLFLIFLSSVIMMFTCFTAIWKSIKYIQRNSRFDSDCVTAHEWWSNCRSLCLEFLLSVCCIIILDCEDLIPMQSPTGECLGSWWTKGRKFAPHLSHFRLTNTDQSVLLALHYSTSSVIRTRVSCLHYTTAPCCSVLLALHYNTSSVIRTRVS